MSAATFALGAKYKAPSELEKNGIDTSNDSVVNTPSKPIRGEAITAPTIK